MSKSILYKELIDGKEYYIYVPSIDKIKFYFTHDGKPVPMKFKKMILIPADTNKDEFKFFWIDKVPIKLLIVSYDNDPDHIFLDKLDQAFYDYIIEYISWSTRPETQSRQWEVTCKLIWENLVIEEHRKPWDKTLEKIKV